MEEKKLDSLGQYERHYIGIQGRTHLRRKMETESEGKEAWAKRQHWIWKERVPFGVERSMERRGQWERRMGRGESGQQTPQVATVWLQDEGDKLPGEGGRDGWMERQVNRKIKRDCFLKNEI